MPLPLIKSDSSTTIDSVWGAPALALPVASLPTTETAASVTQDTLAANEAERVAIAAAQLPPPPFAVPFVSQDGRVSQGWIAWLTKLYQRVGSTSVTSATDMDILTEFDDLPEAPRPVDDPLAWMASLTAEAQLALLARQVDALTALVLTAPERGWNRQSALTGPAAAAPAGGAGTAAGGWDTAANRDAAIATINNLRTRVNELEARLQTLRIL